MTSGDPVPGKDSGKPTDLATETDIQNLFLLALGRPVESPAPVAGFLGQPLAHLAQNFFTCPEFDNRIVQPVAAGQRLPAPADASVPTALTEWAARRLPLSKTGAMR